ncbi:nicotinate-nucleotide pyrophosphorylase [Ferroglobus placidus DSM 10642]|uniref:Nicotinate-nucleotide pyrophosphorylase [carboxylating] n=1 Tax=Ferroglobus placidus (strain DSM 10642 / AEDII12DO) TaxID=589924 RepID=D3S1P8_FERPA|nr:carboxylating nicotinate-nucleotide diphosphorylase [Ferroglobus placidus]ADC64355.1 nicotinate-nucleotide pyrophosphorylase [Ferroglobus placidus DSM 10642]
MILKKLLEFVEEDAPFGDLTSEILPDVSVEAFIVAKQSGVVAGLEEAKELFEHFGVEVKLRKRDGQEVEKEEVLMELFGNVKKVLLVERTALNVIGRMSGIATKTRRVAEKVKKVNSKVRIAATRKTCPGMRLLDKKAVFVGGGEIHRYSLSDCILIKDNHLAVISLEEAIKRAKSLSLYKKVVVEVSDAESALKAAELGADVIMFDNMDVGEIEKAIAELKKRTLRERVLLEISGGVTEDNIIDYAKLDVDVISMGELTHSVENFDVSLEIRKVLK